MGEEEHEWIEVSFKLRTSRPRGDAEDEAGSQPAKKPRHDRDRRSGAKSKPAKTSRINGAVAKGVSQPIIAAAQAGSGGSLGEGSEPARDDDGAAAARADEASQPDKGTRAQAKSADAVQDGSGAAGKAGGRGKQAAREGDGDGSAAAAADSHPADDSHVAAETPRRGDGARRGSKAASQQAPSRKAADKDNDKAGARRRTASTTKTPPARQPPAAPDAAAPEPSASTPAAAPRHEDTSETRRSGSKRSKAAASKQTSASAKAHGEPDVPHPAAQNASKNASRSAAGKTNTTDTNNVPEDCVVMLNEDLFTVRRVMARTDGPEENMAATTAEVDYMAILKGESMDWFREAARELAAEGSDYPSATHGFCATLANIHRAHPRLAQAFEEGKNRMSFYSMDTYESAGVWVDTAGKPCLVVRAVFEDNETQVRLLYETDLIGAKKLVKEPGQWIVLDTGTGAHLKRGRKGIVCDGPPQQPEPGPDE